MKKIYFLATTILFLLPAMVFCQSVGAGFNHSFYVCADGTVAATGNNPEGQLGNGTTASDSMPQPNGMTGVIKADGSYHSLFLKSDGTVWGCGQNYGGQLGNGTYTNTSTPVQVSGLTNIIDIIATDGFSMFLRSDSTVWTAGPNNYGQLGDGTTTDHPSPVQVTSLSGIIDIAGGAYHALFLKSDGTVYACGYNLYGQLGQGASGTSPNPTPLLISGLTNVVQIAAADQRSIFIKSDGTVWGCGYNNNGELGMTGGYNVPTQATSLSGIVDASAGRYHTAFLKNDGTVWSAGLNNLGQLGNGTTTASTTPVQATGITNANMVACGFFFTLCKKTDGTFSAWGSNGYGQLGNNSMTNSNIPIVITTGCTGGGTVMPAAPSSLTVTPLFTVMPTGDISLTWTDNSTNEDGFRIDRSPDGSAWAALDSTATGISSFVDTTSVPGNHYYYRVAAYNTAGLSAYSNTADAIALVSNVGQISMSNSNLSIFPNPSTTTISVLGAAENSTIEIFNLDGKCVTVAGSPTQINISTFENGIYYLKVIGKNNTEVLKFVRIE